MMPRSSRMHRFVPLALVGALACTSTEPNPAPPREPSATGPGATPADPDPFISPADGPGASPTPPPLPADPPPRRGAASSTCERGWVRPRPQTPLFTEPIGIIRRSARFSGPYEVVDMRYFVGPESPPSDTKGYLQDIERWYVKLYATDDPGFQGRFLVEARRFGRGLVAVAPYDSAGFSSPDWVGFQWNAADTQRKRYEGLPGKWSGVPYDFVEGGAGLTIPGLPAELVGCMDGA